MTDAAHSTLLTLKEAADFVDTELRRRGKRPKTAGPYSPATLRSAILRDVRRDPDFGARLQAAKKDDRRAYYRLDALTEWLDNRPGAGARADRDGRTTPAPGESFAEVHPDKAAEWHPTKNGDLTPDQVKKASHQAVWWKCARGHEWQQSVGNRHKGHDCRRCEMIRRMSESARSGGSLADIRPDIAAYWHPTKNGDLTPHDVTYGWRTKVWWQCPTNPDHEWHKSPWFETRMITGRDDIERPRRAACGCDRILPPPTPARAGRARGRKRKRARAGSDTAKSPSASARPVEAPTHSSPSSVNE